MTTFYSRVNRPSKPAFCFFLPLLCLSANAPLAAQTPHIVVIPRASQAVFSHLGVHTHANYLLFDTSALDIAQMRRDPAHFPHLTLHAYSSLPTDRAALPPDLAAFSSPGDPPLPNPYGPIDGGNGKPGWTLLPTYKDGKNFVKVLVPTRFADWLAAQPLARRRLYLQPACFTLRITWG